MLTVNCEGCEFEVLPALILNNLTQYFRNIQFATHVGFLTDTPCIYCQIEQSLERTHQINYHYNMLWEGWILKNRTGASSLVNFLKCAIIIQVIYIDY